MPKEIPDYDCVCPVDFDAINRAAISTIRDLLPALVPGGDESPNVDALRNVQRRGNGPLGSLLLNRLAGSWGHYEVVAQGDDLVRFIAHSLGISQHGAAQIIAAFLGIEWQAAPGVGKTTEGGR
jgi:hypothetical protein